VQTSTVGAVGGKNACLSVWLCRHSAHGGFESIHAASMPLQTLP
jgi:hypothetical protein